MRSWLRSNSAVSSRFAPPFAAKSRSSSSARFQARSAAGPTTELGERIAEARSELGDGCRGRGACVQSSGALEIAAIAARMSASPLRAPG